MWEGLAGVEFDLCKPAGIRREWRKVWMRITSTRGKRI